MHAQRRMGPSRSVRSLVAIAGALVATVAIGIQAADAATPTAGIAGVAIGHAVRPPAETSYACASARTSTTTSSNKTVLTKTSKLVGSTTFFVCVDEDLDTGDLAVYTEALVSRYTWCLGMQTEPFIQGRSRQARSVHCDNTGAHYGPRTVRLEDGTPPRLVVKPGSPSAVKVAVSLARATGNDRATFTGTSR